MPVMKYKNFEDARNDLNRILPEDPINKLLRLQRLVNQLQPPKPVHRGIFKFKTMAEANKHRENP